MDADKDQLNGNNVVIAGVFRQGEAQRKGTGLLHEITSCRLARTGQQARESATKLPANEAEIAGDLRALHTACVSYGVAYGIGYPAGLSDLGPSTKLDRHGAGLIDGELASGTKHGYGFTYAPGKPAAGKVSMYTIHADPVALGRAGQRHFFMNETGVIRVNATARASVTNAPWTDPQKSAPITPGGVSKSVPPAGNSGNPQRIPISAEVQAAKLISRVSPRYPELARQARIQGTVRLRAVIAREGTVQQLEVVSGPPILISAAIEAVKQWRYTPTLQNGEPVEVETEIDVIFSLGGNPPGRGSNPK